MSTAGAIKIMVGAGLLQDILKQHPEAEMELVGSAVAQIAGRMVERIKDQLPNATAQIDAAFKKQLADLGSTRLKPEVKAIIKSYIAEECAEAVKALLAKEATEQALVRVNDLVKARMLAFEKELATVLASAEAKLDTYLVKRAGEEFVKLVRNVSKIGE